MVELDLIIRDDFAAAVPPLTDEEFAGLEANILSDGEVRDKILYWNDGKHNVIIDGMHRWKIIKKHPTITFHTEPVVFKNATEALIWIKRHACHRRNLTAIQRTTLIGEIYNLEKGVQGGNHTSKKPQNVAKAKAQDSAVSPATVKRAAAIATALKTLPEPLQIAIKKDPGATQQQVIACSKAPPAKQGEIARLLRTGAEKSLTSAMITAHVPAVTRKPTHKPAPAAKDEAKGCDCSAKLACPHCEGHYCEHCEPDHEDTCRQAQESRIAKASKPAAAELKKARSGIGIVVRFITKYRPELLPGLNVYLKAIG